MAHKLTDAEWEDLVNLISSSPAERIDQALRRIMITIRPHSAATTRLAYTFRPRSVEGWLIQLGSISPGAAFDRALLAELRRLSTH
jgi:hypothetical protein